jgi:hypothetical protein
MAKSHPSSVLRLVMDIFLVIALLVAALAYLQPSPVNAQPPTQAQAVSGQGSPGDASLDQLVTSTLDTPAVTSTVTLDIKTLAAVIAAENVALIQLQYSIDMPVVIR